MTDESLQRAEEWDWERSTSRAAVKRPRAVVSVAFSRDDFERLDEYASNHGMKLSELIRDAALARIAEIPTLQVVENQEDGRSVLVAGALQPRTAVSGGTIPNPDQKDITSAA
jgi:hypothetical protein